MPKPTPSLGGKTIGEELGAWLLLHRFSFPAWTAFLHLSDTYVPP